MSAMLPVTTEPPVRIWQINDCEWVAARTLTQAIDCLIGTTGCSRENVWDNARALTPHELAKLTFFTDEEEPDVPGSYKRHSFAKQLAVLIERGADFPCYFASTEF